MLVIYKQVPFLILFPNFSKLAKGDNKLSFLVFSSGDRDVLNSYSVTTAKRGSGH